MRSRCVRGDGLGNEPGHGVLLGLGMVVVELAVVIEPSESQSLPQTGQLATPFPWSHGHDGDFGTAGSNSAERRIPVQRSRVVGRK